MSIVGLLIALKISLDIYLRFNLSLVYIFATDHTPPLL